MTGSSKASVTVSGARRKPTPLPLSYAELFRASSVARIAMIKAGISASEAKRIIAGMEFAQSVGFSALNLSAATVNRKAARNESLSPSESERVLGIARLRGQLEVMVEESGSSEEFDAAAWMRFGCLCVQNTGAGVPGNHHSPQRRHPAAEQILVQLPYRS